MDAVPEDQAGSTVPAADSIAGPPRCCYTFFEPFAAPPAYGAVRSAAIRGGAVGKGGGEFSPGTANWTLADTPSPGQTHSFLDSVSCATTTSCTAIGDYDDIKGTETTLGAFGAGTSWSFGATPTIPSENTFARGVSCPTVTECILVGFAKNSAGTLVTFAGQTP